MGLFRLATLCGVTIHCSHFEELTSFKGVGKNSGSFMLNLLVRRS